MGQYMAYGPKAVKALEHWLNLDLMVNVPLDDHAIIWILRRYNLIRGRKIVSTCEDRQQGNSFRRLFVTGYNEDELKDSTCNYPDEEFQKEF